MKRKLIIITASIVVLAVIVAMGIYAQGGSKSSNSVANEQTDKNLPDHCKKCPRLSECSEANGKTAESTDACKKMCEEKKSCGDKMKSCEKKSCGDSTKCGDKMKCAEKMKCGDASKCCEKKTDAKECTPSADCKKECEKKSN